MIKKKSLGQHFLHNTHYLQLVVDAAGVAAGERVLEVGPGDGALTAELLKRGAQVVAVEKDSRLLPLLREKFAAAITDKKLIVVEADALEFDAAKYFKKKPYKIVANIPYYITGALLKKFFSEKTPPTRMALLVQKEVAERIARSKKESILSLSVKAYGTPKYIKTVPRGAFSPAPSVDSAILAVENISRSNFKNVAREKKFFALVKAGFTQKRKLLKRNLEKVLGKKALAALQKANIPENVRAEDVPLQKWLEL
jgi:16S rRNA (adenine1518-N6/adenine1519-N6)-dimethyltransferase